MNRIRQRYERNLIQVIGGRQKGRDFGDGREGDFIYNN